MFVLVSASPRIRPSFLGKYVYPGFDLLCYGRFQSDQPCFVAMEPCKPLEPNHVEAKKKQLHLLADWIVYTNDTSAQFIPEKQFSLLVSRIKNQLKTNTRIQFDGEGLIGFEIVAQKAQDANVLVAKQPTTTPVSSSSSSSSSGLLSADDAAHPTVVSRTETEDGTHVVIAMPNINKKRASSTLASSTRSTSEILYDPDVVCDLCGVPVWLHETRKVCEPEEVANRINKSKEEMEKARKEVANPTCKVCGSSKCPHLVRCTEPKEKTTKTTSKLCVTCKCERYRCTCPDGFVPVLDSSDEDVAMEEEPKTKPLKNPESVSVAASRVSRNSVSDSKKPNKPCHTDSEEEKEKTTKTTTCPGCGIVLGPGQRCTIHNLVEDTPEVFEQEEEAKQSSKKPKKPFPPPESLSDDEEEEEQSRPLKKKKKVINIPQEKLRPGIRYISVILVDNELFDSNIYYVPWDAYECDWKPLLGPSRPSHYNDFSAFTQWRRRLDEVRSTHLGLCRKVSEEVSVFGDLAEVVVRDISYP